MDKASLIKDLKERYFLYENITSEKIMNLSITSNIIWTFIKILLLINIVLTILMKTEHCEIIYNCIGLCVLWILVIMLFTIRKRINLKSKCSSSYLRNLIFLYSEKIKVLENLSDDDQKLLISQLTKELEMVYYIN